VRRLRMILAAFIAAGALLAPSQARAQAAPEEARAGYVDTGADAPSVAERLRPELRREALFSRSETADALRAPAAVPLVRERQVRNRRGVPLMVAGGILFVAGAIAGDDVGTIFMLGGAGVAAWGAYVYFGG